MDLTLDLFIQDFVNSNKLLNQNVGWTTLVSRRFTEAGGIKVLEFTSGGQVCTAVAQRLELPDTDWFRIELVHSAALNKQEHRFDCLRMLHQATHADLKVECCDTAVLVKLTTRNRGLINIVFVIRAPDLVSSPLTNPFLYKCGPLIS
jgi:hypothetical protein